MAGGAVRPAGRSRRDQRARKPGSTAARIIVAVPWAAFAVLIVAVGGDLFAFAVIGFGIVALHELYRMLEPARPIVLAGLLSMSGLVLAAQYGDQFHIVLVSAASVPVVFVLALTRRSRRNVTLGMAVTLLGVLWVGMALAHAVMLRNLEHGDGLIVDVLVGTFLGDTGAYFGGRLWGRRPLAPHISPTKTVEGLVVGFVVGTLALWFAGLYQDWLSGVEALVLGASVAAAAPLGDLFESLIKRDIGVKDTGGLFGVHGGVLDRLDAVFFTVVVGFYVARALGFGAA